MEGLEHCCNAIRRVQRSRHPMRIAKLVFVLLLATCAWSAAAPASAAPGPLPPLTPVTRRSLPASARPADRVAVRLERARSLFALGRVRSEFGHVAGEPPHAATLHPHATSPPGRVSSHGSSADARPSSPARTASTPS